MFDRILQGLHEVEGVQATLVVDAGGTILGLRAHPVYDLALLQQVSHTIISAVDSVQLIQEDWELITATFSDGKVLIRNLRPANRQNRTVILAVVADIRLNPSFAGVAIRVAAAKLKGELESPAAANGAASAPPPAASPQQPVMSGSFNMKAVPTNGRAITNSGAGSSLTPEPAPRPELANSGLSWSGLNRSFGGASTSGVSVADEASSRYLTACTKALSNSVGPMAKVFIKDAVRKVCPDRSFSREDAASLVAELGHHITDPADLQAFYQALKSA